MISISKLLNESQDRIYLLSGVLITDGAVRNQKDILSDIRSLHAVTVVRSIEMEDDPTSKYDSAELSFDSYDGEMSTPKSKISKIERESRKMAKYVKKHPEQNDTKLVTALISFGNDKYTKA
jgi:hypothetical protein